MGADISFECGPLHCPDGFLPLEEMSGTESDIFWDQIMIDVCHILTVGFHLEKEWTPVGCMNRRFVIKFMLDIDVSKWDDEKVFGFGTLFLFFDDSRYKFNRKNIKDLLDKRTDYHKYLV